MMKNAISLLILALAFAAGLSAADKTYVITELRPAAAGGIELVLRDLESGSQGKLLSLVVYDRDRLVDLAAAEEIPATRARQGDILFLGKSNGKATQMIITPGRSVHPKLASGQAAEAKVINELSRRVAAESARRRRTRRTRRTPNWSACAVPFSSSSSSPWAPRSPRRRSGSSSVRSAAPGGRPGAPRRRKPSAATRRSWPGS